MTEIRSRWALKGRRAILIFTSVAAALFVTVSFVTSGAVASAAVAALIGAEGPTGTYALTSGLGRSRFVQLWTLHGWICVATTVLALFVVNHTQASDVTNGVMLLVGLSLLSFHIAMTIYAIAVLTRKSPRSIERWVAGELLIVSAAILAVVLIEES